MINTEFEQEIIYMKSLLEMYKIPHTRKGYYFVLPVNMKITLRSSLCWETPFSYSKSKSMDTIISLHKILRKINTYERYRIMLSFPLVLDVINDITYLIFLLY